MVASSNPATSDTTDRQIVVSRLFDAPREVVFKAWTSVEHLSNWFGPNGWSTTTESFDFRPGGAWKFTMDGPDDLHFANYIEFQEIDPPARLTYRHGSGTEDDVEGMQTTVAFEDQGGKTLLTMTAVFVTKEARDLVVEQYGAIEGGKQTLEKLAAYVAQLQ
jgi:uncharacterized protein YndB with AHSA1/START domain